MLPEDVAKDNKGRRVIFVALSAALVLLIGFSTYYYQSPTRRYQKILQNLHEMTPVTVDFKKASQELESVLVKHQRTFSLEEGLARIRLADSLSEIDRQRGTQILKEVANDSRYPAEINAIAINFIINDHELDFIDNDFPVKEIFTGGGFENLLSEASENVELAIRKLNERSYFLFPNPIAALRIAKWYATEIYKNQNIPLSQKDEYSRIINEYVTSADNLLPVFEDGIIPKQYGLAHELKARINNLIGGNLEKTRQLFDKSIGFYTAPPGTIFQRIYLSRTSLYYAAFLMRNNLVTPEEIRAFLNSLYVYLATPQEPRQKNVRMVSFLIAARDAERVDYPNVDFNKTDVENIKRFYPELGELIERLDLREYVRGHPLEEKFRQ